MLIGLKLPPGPPGKPLIGHFFELSKVLQPGFIYDWKKEYGLIFIITTIAVQLSVPYYV